nr:carbohydrate ABC transporter substrate-binding protein [uncultured Oscillibacter sp.]
MKKFLSLLLTLALALSLAACGGKDAGTTAPPPAESNGDSGQTEAPPPAEDVTITVAALASGYEEAYPGMWQEVCDAFTEATGVKVNLICDKNLEDVIGPSMQGGDFPDVIHLATGREKGLTEQFIKDRNIAELTDVLSMTVPGESVKVSDKIVGGFTDTSVTNPYGADFFNKATTYAEGIWDTPEAQQCFDIIAKLASYTNPVTPAQANDQDFTQNQQLVMDNKALFMPNGTWIVGEMAEAPRAEGFKWGMTALPAAKAGGNGASYCWLEQAWIPAAAPNLDAAKQFVAFLYSDAACAIFAKGGAVQPVPGLTDNLEGDNKMFYSIYDNGADAAMGNFAAYNAVAGLGTVREVFLDPVNGLVNGSVTVDQWISDVKAASDQMRANIMG